MATLKRNKIMLCILSSTTIISFLFLSEIYKASYMQQINSLLKAKLTTTPAPMVYTHNTTNKTLAAHTPSGVARLKAKKLIKTITKVKNEKQ